MNAYGKSNGNSMRKQSVLKRQAVKRRKKKRNPRSSSNLLKRSSLIGSYFIRSCCFGAALVFISLLFLCLYQYLLTCPSLKLRHVFVTGVDAETKQELVQVSGLSPESSLMAISLDEVKERMEKHPWIKSVELEKRFPHTLLVRAEKETPSAVVLMDGLYYMNESGRVFKGVDQKEDIDYPVITGVSAKADRREWQLKQAAQVLKSLETEKGHWSPEALSEIHIKKDGVVSLYFGSLKAPVNLRAAELGERMDELKKIVEHLDRSGRIHVVKGINLNYRDGAAVSFKNG